jgi:hypothetical protein
MTPSPLDVLRDAFDSRVQDMWDPASDKRQAEFDAALADVDKLVEAAQRAERKLRIEYHRGLAEGKIAHEITDESWAEGEDLADALRPFTES